MRRLKTVPGGFSIKRGMKKAKQIIHMTVTVHDFPDLKVLFAETRDKLGWGKLKIIFLQKQY